MELHASPYPNPMIVFTATNAERLGEDLLLGSE